MAADDRQARYDETYQAWMIRRYADVVAALREPALVAGGEDESTIAHATVHAATRRAYASDRLAEWRDELEASAKRFAEQLAIGAAVDLVRDLATPWCVGLAMKAAGTRSDRAIDLARVVFLAAAHATDANASNDATTAVTELAQMLERPANGTAAHVQAFVALSQTLPCFLGGAWLALFEHPDQLALLRAERELMPRAIEELLRYAGPSRAVFRQAKSDVCIGDASIGANERVVLLLNEANRDPERFADPDRLDLRRDASAHVGFGKGAHSCAGSSIIRMAAAVATSALLDVLGGVESIGDVEWIDGFAIRGPASLPVVLRRADL